MEELLLIENNTFSLHILGNISKNKLLFKRSKEFNNLNNAPYIINSEILPNSITINNQKRIITQNSIYGEAIFFEGNTYQFKFSFKDQKTRAIILTNIKKEENHISKKGNLIYTQNFDNYIGYHSIDIVYYNKDNINHNFSFEYCIYPVKLKYDDDFYRLLEDILKESIRLNFNILSITSFRFSLENSTSNKFIDAIIWIQLLLSLSKDIIKSFEIIKNHPHKHISQTENFLPKRMIKNFNYSLCHRSNIVLSRINTETIHTKENKLVKYYLLKIHRELLNYEKIFQNNSNLSSFYKNKFTSLKIYIEKILYASFFKDIKEENINIYTSPILEKKCGYASFNKIYNLLSKNRISTSQQKTPLRIKQISTLYEIWTFIITKKIIEIKYNIKNNIKENNDNIFSQLLRGEKSKIEFAMSNFRISLYYNPTISRKKSDIKGMISYIEEHRPDILIEIKKDNYVQYIVLDAKYRSIYKRGEYFPLPDSINQIHRYRDALVSQSNDKSIKNIWGGFVLFPGYNSENDIKNSYYYKSINITQIGAIQLVPSNNDGLDLFKDILSSTIDDILRQQDV